MVARGGSRGGTKSLFSTLRAHVTMPSSPLWVTAQEQLQTLALVHPGSGLYWAPECTPSPPQQSPGLPVVIELWGGTG